MSYAKIKLNGSKSIYIRALALALKNKEPIKIYNPSICNDAILMESLVQALGAKITKNESYHLITASHNIPSSEIHFHAQDSGLVSRLAVAFLSFCKNNSTINFHSSLQKRPYLEFLSALKTMGISWSKSFPLTKLDGSFKNTSVDVPTLSSSQFLSSLLLTSYLQTQLSEFSFNKEMKSVPYFFLTLSLLNQFKIQYQLTDNKITIPPQQTPDSSDFTIEPDASSCAFFYLYAYIAKQPLYIPYVKNSLQADFKLNEFLNLMGCEFEFFDSYALFVPPTFLNPIGVDLSSCPDLFPVLAIFCAFAEGKSRIYGAPHLKYKESNRIHSLTIAFRQLGIPHVIRDDGMEIWGPWKPSPNSVTIDDFNDHRIAMAFSVLGFIYPQIKVRNTSCIKKSFPDFFEKFLAIIPNLPQGFPNPIHEMCLQTIEQSEARQQEVI